jgi:hypothetical protein
MYPFPLGVLSSFISSSRLLFIYLSITRFFSLFPPHCSFFFIFSCFSENSLLILFHSVLFSRLVSFFSGCSSSYSCLLHCYCPCIYLSTRLFSSLLLFAPLCSSLLLFAPLCSSFLFFSLFHKLFSSFCFIVLYLRKKSCQLSLFQVS